MIDGLLQRRFLYSMTAPTGGGETAVALLLAAAGSKGREHPTTRSSAEAFSILRRKSRRHSNALVRNGRQMAFDVDDIDVQFIAGVISIAEMSDQLKGEIAAEGEVTAVVVDTAAAYFDGDDENDNVQMGKYARTLRRLTTLRVGLASLFLAIRPRTRATTTCCPRGGGAFIAEMDGDLVCLKKDGVVDLSWHGEFSRTRLSADWVPDFNGHVRGTQRQ